MKAKSKNGLITLLPLIALGALQVWYQSLTHVLIIYTVILLAYQSGDINGRSTKGDVPFYNILIPLAGVAVLLVQQQTIQLLICISMAIIQNQCQQLAKPPLERKKARSAFFKVLFLIAVLFWTLSMDWWLSLRHKPQQNTQAQSPLPAYLQKT